MNSEEEDSDVEFSDGDDSGGLNNYEIVDSNNKPYKILEAADITQRQNDDISAVSNFLSVSRGTACSLLRYYNWIIEDIYDHWFTDENKVREAVGLLQLPEQSNGNNSLPFSCGICFDDFSTDNPMISISDSCVAHSFCLDCLKSYIHLSIDGGSGCLTLRCPEPKCNALVDFDIVDCLASDEDKEKYLKYLQQSYVEDSKIRKWCTGPDCSYVVENVIEGSENYDVECKCYNKFCWNCNEDSHRPVDCEQVKEWIKKNGVESANTLWILKNTKPCPKCKKPIEKNQGCNHMTCRAPCRHQFCWLCLESYRNHVTCNRYVESTEGELAKKELEKYAHYYERWAFNDSSRKKAMEDLKLAKNVHVDNLMRKYEGMEEKQVEFLIDAWEQIVDCRRVLKWSYTYGFYMPEMYNTRKKSLFEFIQGEAERALEKLHHCVEHEIEPYLIDGAGDPPLEKFTEFRTKMIGLTTSAKKIFGNFLIGLENDLPEVESFIDVDSLIWFHS